jgi:hypothetical protein
MKHIKPFILITEATTFESEYAQKYKPEGYNLIATNESNWHWEYDNVYKYAFLYMNNTGNLLLKVIDVHVKTGIGAGTRDTLLFEDNVGTINKPDTKNIQETLKKFSSGRGRMSQPFSRNDWKPTFSDEKITLGTLLKDPRTSRGFKAASVLEDEPSIETQTPTNDKTKKREKLAILHKNLYKLSDAELDDLLTKLK